MENSKEFYFDYKRFEKSSLSYSQLDSLLSKIVEFKIPKMPIPYIGPYIELAMLVTQVAGIIKLISMKKDKVDTELMIEKQIHDQNLRLGHDSDVLN